MTNKDTCLGEKVKCHLFDIQFEHTQIISSRYEIVNANNKKLRLNIIHTYLMTMAGVLQGEGTTSKGGLGG